MKWVSSHLCLLHRGKRYPRIRAVDSLLPFYKRRESEGNATTIQYISSCEFRLARRDCASSIFALQEPFNTAARNRRFRRLSKSAALQGRDAVGHSVAVGDLVEGETHVVMPRVQFRLLLRGSGAHHEHGDQEHE